VARDKAVSTSLRSITVLDILSKTCRYALTRAPRDEIRVELGIGCRGPEVALGE
jgi:hypothetical protein